VPAAGLALADGRRRRTKRRRLVDTQRAISACAICGGISRA